MMPRRWSRKTGPHSRFNPCCIGLDNDAGRRENTTHSLSRFNPCCIGLDNDAAQAAQRLPLGCGVSNLVVLDWTMMRHAAPSLCRPGTQVSILVVLDWTMMPSTITDSPVRRGVSILVVLDWTMMLSPACATPNSVYVSILVVLDWTMMPRPDQSPSKLYVWFQSLLYWIGQ